MGKFDHKIYCAMSGFLFLSGVAIAAPSKLELVPSQCHIAFHGSSNTHGFEGSSQLASGVLEVDYDAERLLQHSIISIPIRGFGTGNLSRDHAMQHMFEMGKFPEIEFLVEKIQLLDEKGVDTAHKFYQLDGSLKIHQISKPVSLKVKAEFSSEGVTVSGETDLTTEMFGLKAPVMLGLFRVNKEVKVFFETFWKKV